MHHEPVFYILVTVLFLAILSATFFTIFFFHNLKTLLPDTLPSAVASYKTQPYFWHHFHGVVSVSRIWDAQSLRLSQWLTQKLTLRCRNRSTVTDFCAGLHMYVTPKSACPFSSVRSSVRREPKRISDIRTDDQYSAEKHIYCTNTVLYKYHMHDFIFIFLY